MRSYVKFIYKQTNNKNLFCYIFGIPAPKIIKDDERAYILKKIIKKYNFHLKNICKEKGINFIDVYAHTKTNLIHQTKSLC